jgi:autotransporter-associated beta strand protein
MSGWNGYTGATSVTGGTLQLGNGASGERLVSAVALSNNATMVFNHADTLEFYVAVTGTGSVVKNGPGVLEIDVNSGVNTYNGGTTINNGTIQSFLTDNALPQTGTLTVNTSGTFDLNGNNQTVGGLAGSGLVTSAGFDVLTVNAPLAGSTTFSGTITETATPGMAVQLTGSGQLTLNGTDSYSGGTQVSGGTLNVGGASSVPSAGVTTVMGSAPISLASLLLGGGVSGGPLEFAGLPAAVPAVLSDIQSSPSVANMATLGGAPALPQGGAGSAVSGIALPSSGPANVPEPGTVALLLVGALCGLGVWLKRRK